MKTAIVILLGAAGAAVAGYWFRDHRRRVAEAEELDRQYRESVIRREKIKARSDEEEDYLLKIRAGMKPKDPSSASSSNPARNKFLD